MSVNYTRINWEDSPSTQTPLNAENLNAMDSAIDELAGAVNNLDGVTDDIEELENEVGAIKNDLSQVSDVTNVTDNIALSFKTENVGYGIRFATGALIANNMLSTTDYINVSMYSKLLYKRIGATSSTPVYGMSFYDKDKVAISGERALNAQSTLGYVDTLKEIGVPENAVYARFSVFSDTVTYGNFEVKGTSKLFDNITDIDSRVVTNEDILSFEENIPMVYDITETARYVEFSTGVTKGSTPYNCTGYINVQKYGSVTYKGILTTATAVTIGMAFYDEEKQYISGERCLVGAQIFGYRDNQVVLVPDNAVYARFTTLADVTTYGAFSLSGKSKLFYGVYPYKSAFQKNIKFGSFSSEWYKGQGESYEGFTINTLYADMVTAWDALLADSNGCMTKETIGTSSDDQTMYCYKLIPLRYRNAVESSITNNPPTFLVVPSQHGFEKSAAFGTYYFARDLIYNYDKNPVLNSIRKNCAIYFVPVGNPYGFDNKQRKNANGVDLNRNWGEPDGSSTGGSTDPSSPYYAGETPFDQPETQAIKGVIDTTQNLFFVVDYHTNGQYQAASWADVNWLAYPHGVVEDEYLKQSYYAGQYHVSDITENLLIEYGLDTGGSAIGSITIGASGGVAPTLGYYARTQNIMGFTFEGNNGLPSETGSYSTMEQKINSELIGNWIKNLLLVFKDASLR